MKIKKTKQLLVTKRESKNMFIKNTLSVVVSAALLSGAVSNVASAKEFKLADGWVANAGLFVHAVALNIDIDSTDSNGVTSNQSTSRIQTGYTPASFTAGLTAPEYRGVTAGITFQYAQAINSQKQSGDAAFNRFSFTEGAQSQVRVADISLTGDFGSVLIGRNFGIFGVSALVHNSANLSGVGAVTGVDNGGGAIGHIGVGYYYAEFNPGIRYISNNFGGFSYSVGLYDPIDVRDGSDPDANALRIVTRAEDLRLESAINYNSKNFDAWLGYINASSEGEEEINGFDIGGEWRIGGLALTANFSDGDGLDGIGGTPTTGERQQWYAEADYTVGDTTFGLTYGENTTGNAAGVDVSEANLTSVFAHYKLTPTVVLSAEYSAFESNTLGDAAESSTDAISLGVKVSL